MAKMLKKGQRSQFFNLKRMESGYGGQVGLASNQSWARFGNKMYPMKNGSPNINATIDAPQPHGTVKARYDFNMGESMAIKRQMIKRGGLDA